MSYPSHLPPPRLCHLRKWPNFSGYGFNLHAEKGKAGQYIGKVDPDSPADLGGLKTNDFLIEVNGSNVEGFVHQKVVEKVKEMSDMVNMLVVDMETYKYCKENAIVVTADMPQVVVYYTPDNLPGKENNFSQEAKKQDTELASAQEEESEYCTAETEVAVNNAATVSADGEEPDLPVKSETESAVHSQPPQPHHAEPHPTNPVAPSHQLQSSISSSNSNGTSGSDPVANISLEEMRAKLGKNRRTQVKLNPSSFSEKYSMFQQL